MTDEERRIITDFVARISGAGPAPTGSTPWGGSVPSTQQRPPLPPVDPEADALIAQLFQQYPEARYRITQTAFVQEAALVEAQNRIRQLEWERDNARAQAQAQTQAAPRQGGFLGGLFGGGGGQPRPLPMSPPPQPQYPPGYNPQMLAPQRGGSGFLGTALAGAAGVAGGMVLGNALVNMFSHHGQDYAGAAPGGLFGGDAPSPSPWSDPGAVAAAQGWDAGGGMKDATYDDKFGGQPGGFDQDTTPANWGGSGGDDGGYKRDEDYSGDADYSGDDYSGDDGSSNDC
jgi:uncharacterized protein